MTQLYKILILFLLVIFTSTSYSQSVQELVDNIEKEAATGNFQKQAELLNKLAFEYWNNNYFQKAKEEFEKSIILNQKIGNKNALMHIYANIGMIETDTYHYESALFNYRKAFGLAQEFQEKRQIASMHINIGITLQKLKRFYEGIEELQKALEIAKNINDLKLIRRIYGVLSECYEKIGDNVKSMEYFNLYATFEKHIQKEELKKREQENEKIVAQAEEKAKVAKAKQKQVEENLIVQEHELEASKQLTNKQKEELHAKEIEQKALQAELKQKQITQIVTITGLAITLILSFFVFRNNRLRKKANKLLEKQNYEILEKQEIIDKTNRDITKSINYAQGIQKAMLPNESKLHELLPESFMFFKPRDKVSGDFFWFDRTSFKSYVQQSIGNKSMLTDDIIITAVDCTGHGVPGAFMSMLGYNLLDQIISSEVVDPGKILDVLHIGVTMELKQQQSDNKDGMDMALCRINTEQKTVDFAGAKNPLVYVKNNEITVIKGDKYPIGGSRIKTRVPYKQHSVSYADAPTTFYLYSDGFQDQFGGEDGTKFLSKKFRDLLLEHSSKPMSEQKEILKQTLNSWMGNSHKQIDDILIIGFKLS